MVMGNNYNQLNIEDGVLSHQVIFFSILAQAPYMINVHEGATDKSIFYRLGPNRCLEAAYLFTADGMNRPDKDNISIFQGRKCL